MYLTKKSIQRRIEEHAKEIQSEFFGIFLQGSQNYIDDLFYKGSDVDSRAILLPNKKQICLGKDISQPELILDNEEHIDRFDARKFLDLLKTPGINNYEVLFTDYYLINPKYEMYYHKLREIREEVVRADEKKFVMSTMGISMRDLKGLEKRTGGEDYDIETLGYSRKRLANIIRFNKTLKAYIAGEDFSACLKAMDQELIHKVRRTEYYTYDQAVKIANETDSETEKLAKEYPKSTKNKKILDNLDDIIVDLLSARL